MQPICSKFLCTLTSKSCKGSSQRSALMSLVSGSALYFNQHCYSSTDHFRSFSNYTLKHVDASFYQVARGMVLPFTVCTSFFVLHSRPSLRVLLACFLVTTGFFVGVFLDGTEVSVIGVTFGVMSSMITAAHSVVIKRSLDVVKGSALHLSWYTNLYSAIALIPVIVVAGEVPAVAALFAEPGPLAVGISPLSTFLWGSAITVCLT